MKSSRIVGFTATTAIFVLLVALVVFAFRDLSATLGSIEHEVVVQRSLTEAYASVVDAETGQRGYLLTNNRLYLTPYATARSRADETLGTLERVTVDDAAQRAKVEELRPLIQAKFAELARTIELQDAGRVSEAVALVMTDEGRHAMSSIRKVVDDARTEGDQLLAIRRANAENRYKRTTILVLFASVAFGISVLQGWKVRRAINVERARLRTERQAYEERARVAQFQERFLGMLGHDLRNPLSSISMSADLLVATPGLPAVAQRAGERISSSAERMRRMVEQLMDLTRARLAGGIPVHPRPLDAGVLVDQIVDEIRAQHPHVTIEVTRSGDLGGMWDQDRLGQVVSNLVGNAVSYGTADAPVRVAVEGSRADAVVLRIWNDGPPIPSDLQAVLFDAFRRGMREAKDPKSAGLGLGLFITREIVLGHGGTVTVESSDGAGTAFVIVLPRTTGSPESCAE